MGEELPYETYADEDLIRLVRGGDGQALSCLCVRYLPLCRSLARRYAGSMEPDDLMQEGMLGLIEATRRFDCRKQVPFGVYCRRCVTSKMLSALSAARAQKRRANVGSLPYEEHAPQHVSVSPSPDELLIQNEEMLRKNRLIQTLLSHSEQEALRLYLRGCSYAQIAARLKIPQKSVDNALQRVRRKLRAALYP